MKLDGDKVVLESRRDIEIMQNMIDTYIKSGKASESEKEELKNLNGRLEGLWFSW